MSASKQNKRPYAVALGALLLAAAMWTSVHGQGLPPFGGVKGGVPPRDRSVRPHTPSSGREEPLGARTSGPMRPEA